MEFISSETKKFYRFLCRSDNITEFSRMKKYKPMEVNELYCFLATASLMLHSKKLQLNNFWSTDPYISSRIFSRLIKKERFILTLKMVKFSDNDNIPIDKDPFLKIRVIVDHLRVKFKERQKWY